MQWRQAHRSPSNRGQAAEPPLGLVPRETLGIPALNRGVPGEGEGRLSQEWARGGERLEGSAKPTGPLNPGRGLATACTTAPRPAGKAPPRRRAVPRSASRPALPSPAARAGDVLGRPTASPACWHEPGSEGGRWTPPGKGVSRVGLGEPCQPASPASIHSTVTGAEQVAHPCLRYLWDRPSGALKDLADH